MARENTQFVQGLYWKKRNEKTPEFVKGGVNIKKDEFLEFVSSLDADERGFLSFDLLTSKAGKPYFTYYNPKEDSGGDDLDELAF